MFTLRVFGDESANATKSSVFAVAAVVGVDSEWEPAIRAWTARTGGKPFHANRCESEFVRDSERQKHKDNLATYRDLTFILADSALVGISYALDLRSLRECLPDVPFDLAYYKCFADLVRTAADMARRFNALEDEERDVRLKFTFDSRLESDGTAGTIYTVVRNLPEWEGSDVFEGERVYFEPDPSPQLEMADLLAREAMKELDRTLTGARPEARRSYQTLRDAQIDGTRKFIFQNRDRAYCELWRDQVKSPETQAMRAEYEKWLIATKRVQNGHPADTMANRMLFYGDLERREAAQR